MYGFINKQRTRFQCSSAFCLGCVRQKIMIFKSICRQNDTLSRASVACELRIEWACSRHMLWN